MANSSKKISKVVAIAMASAMAMSSLSAALVSVSAISDPTASSVGNVDFAAGEKAAIEGELGAVDSKIDAIVGKSLDLGSLIKAADLDLVYTDENGIERPVDVDEVTFKVTSGSSYARVATKDTDTEKKDNLYAKKAGTATLQIKATGTVNLGDSKKEKDVTFTHNITIDVHEDKEIGLAAYRDVMPLSSDDLNDLAAYDVNNIDFKLVTYHADGDKFQAVINAASIGDSSTTPPDLTPDVNVDAIVAQLAANGADKVAQAALKKNGVLVKQPDGSFIINLDVLTAEEQKGVLTPAVPYANDQEVKDAVTVTTTPGKNQDLAAKAVYQEGSDYFALPTTTVPNVLKENTSATKKYYDKNTSTLTDNNSGTVQVKVYTLKTLDELKAGNINKVDAVTLSSQDKDAAKKLIQEAIDKISGEKPPVGQKVTVDAVIEYLKKQGNLSQVGLDNLRDAITGTNGELNEKADVTKIVTEVARKGYKAQVTDFAENTIVKTDAVKYTDATDLLNDLKNTKNVVDKTISNGVANSAKKFAESADSVHKIGTQSGKTLYVAKATDFDITKMGDGSVDATNYFTEVAPSSNKKWSMASDGAITEVDNITNGTEVKVYALVDDSAAQALDKTPAVYYTQSEYNTLLETVVNAAGLESYQEQGKTVYYKPAETDTGVPSAPSDKEQKKIVKGYEAFNNALTQAKTEDLTTTLADAIAELKKGTTVDNYALDLGEDDKNGTQTLKSVRFYAGTGAELFELNQENSNGTGDWEKGTKGGNAGITIDEKSDQGDTTPEAKIQLANNGKTGTGSVKAYVTLKGANDVETKEEYVLNFKVNKTVDFGAENVTIDKDGGKTIAKGSALKAIENKSISGYDIRTNGTVTVENGTLGAISADGDVTVSGGKTGDINANETGDVIVGDAIVGNIVDAKNVTLDKGASVGTVSAVTEEKQNDGNVTVNDATVTSIDAEGNVTINGATVKGNVLSDGEIKISGAGEDENGDLLDVTINGSVIASGAKAKIDIDNDSDEGATTIKIDGDVIARYADLQDDEASVVIGSPDTTGVINIAGAAQGEYVQLGGNGLVTLGGVRATDEVDAGDSEGLVADSTLDFNGFNSGINSVTNFAKVKVTDGTAKVSKALTTTTLDLSSDTQLVVSGLTTEDVLNDGTIVAPVGQVTVNGDVDGSAQLRLTGEVTKDVIAFKGGKGLDDAFDLGGLTVQANRQADGSYNYVVTAQELYGLTASGKNVTLGEGQKKEVTVSADAALPQGASIVWESADEDVATVVGNGNTATITGVEVGNTEITAKIVDSTGKDLGYEVATFTTDVLYAETADVIGSEVSVDTASKNMQVGETYNFLVRDIKDTDNIKLSYDANIVDVKLAQADYNGRGALYTITAKANGSTNIGVSYKGATSNIAVKVGGFVLDTSAKTMNVGTTYSFLAKNVKVEEAGNVQFTYDNTVAKVELANADYNGRGALFTVTALKTGSTDIKATYNNEEATMKLDVVEYTGKMTLDTASYTMPLGGTYTIGVKIEKNGKELTGAEVNAMIASGELVVRDSRTGTIINKPEVLANGNVRVTGKNTEGTTYVMFEIVKDGKVATHASIGVTVKAGATAGGSSRRSVSQW